MSQSAKSAKRRRPHLHSSHLGHYHPFSADERETLNVADGTAENTDRIAGLKIRSALFRVRLSAPRPPGAAFKKQLRQVPDLVCMQNACVRVRKARACCSHMVVYAFAFLMHVKNNLGAAVEYKQGGVSLWAPAS